MAGEKEIRELDCQGCDGADIWNHLVGAHFDPLLVLLVADHVRKKFSIFLDLEVLFSQLTNLELVRGKFAHCLAVHRNQDLI